MKKFLQHNRNSFIDKTKHAKHTLLRSHRAKHAKMPEPSVTEQDEVDSLTDLRLSFDDDDFLDYLQDMFDQCGPVPEWCSQPTNDGQQSILADE